MQEKKALERGVKDQTTMANVSLMIYYTPAFENFVSGLREKESTSNQWSDPIRFIKREIAYSNLVLHKNEIPVKFKLHCIEELIDFGEDHKGPKHRIKQFEKAKANLAELVNGADIAILMNGTPTTGNLLSIHFLLPCFLVGQSDAGAAADDELGTSTIVYYLKE